MSAGHTPGPWEFKDNSLVGPKIDDKPVWLRPVILRSEVGVNPHNARLITAAPELLEALQDALAALAENVGMQDTYIDFDQVRAAKGKASAAIAKATGEAT